MTLILTKTVRMIVDDSNDYDIEDIENNDMMT
jgi:hypothetical protein